ncbi:MAG: Gfo/Idh/MocA family protein [Syntrophorhabdaceae bacterium]
MPVNIAVIGLGHMGRIHLGKICAFEGVHVTGIVDVDKSCEECAQKYSVPLFPDYLPVIEASNCAVIATPTESHYAIAKQCLEMGVHVFIEKPITTSPEEGRELVDIARSKDLVLQVGHLERLNPALVEALPHVKKPVLIETRRISPFTGRSTDIDVVLDLMIHDLDLVLSIVGEDVTDIAAQGIRFVTDQYDIVNARLQFSGGCVASLTASRVSAHRERSITIYEQDTSYHVDLMQGKLATVRRIAASQTETSEFTAPQMDPVREELLQFINAVEGHGGPSVTGRDGVRALELANRIRDVIAGKPNGANR